MKQNRIVADAKEITWSSLNAAIGNESSLLYKQRMCVENIESKAIFLVDLWSPKTIIKCVVSGEIGVVFFQSRQVGFRSLRRALMNTEIYTFFEKHTPASVKAEND